MSCPLCREAIHRDTLQLMGLPVGVPELKQNINRCKGVVQLISGKVRNEQALCKWLRHLRGLQTADGFIRSACTLHIERAIFHKSHLAEQLQQMSTSRTGDDLYELYCVSIACHVEVLIAVRNAL